jgi:hypothetical protein
MLQVVGVILMTLEVSFTIVIFFIK